MLKGLCLVVFVFFPACVEGLRLYSDVNLKGECKTIPLPGTDCVNLSQYGWNNKARSADAEGGCIVAFKLDACRSTLSMRITPSMPIACKNDLSKCKGDFAANLVSVGACL